MRETSNHPSLGNTVDEVLDAFAKATKDNVHLIVEAQIVPGPRIRIAGEPRRAGEDPRLGRSIEGLLLKALSSAEHGDFRRALAAGQVQIYLRHRSSTLRVVQVLHQATGRPLAAAA
jgi:plasmid stabilization system protein ParE